MSEKEQDFTPSPEGSIKVTQGTLEVIKGAVDHDAKIGVGQTGKGVKLVVPYGDKTKTVKLPEKMFQGKAGQIEVNKVLKEDLANEALEEDEDCTCTWEMVGGYWQLRRIQPGIVGSPGVRKADENGNVPSASSSSGNGGGFDSAGAAKGQIRTMALEMAIARVGKKVALSDVIEVLEEFESSDIQTMYDLSDKIYAGLSRGGSKSSSSEDDTAPFDDEEADVSPDSDDDEDWDS